MARSRPSQRRKIIIMPFWPRLLVGLAIVCLALPARAQTYPDRPIRLIVPIAAGSVTDVIMRSAAGEARWRG